MTDSPLSCIIEASSIQEWSNMKKQVLAGVFTALLLVDCSDSEEPKKDAVES